MIPNAQNILKAGGKNGYGSIKCQTVSTLTPRDNRMPACIWQTEKRTIADEYRKAYSQTGQPARSVSLTHGRFSHYFAFALRRCAPRCGSTPSANEAVDTAPTRARSQEPDEQYFSQRPHVVEFVPLAIHPIAFQQSGLKCWEKRAMRT